MLLNSMITMKINIIKTWVSRLDSSETTGRISVGKIVFVTKWALALMAAVLVLSVSANKDQGAKPHK